MQIPTFSFTSEYPGIARVLLNKVLISPAHDISQTQQLSPSQDCKEYVAIWDTGATGSVITERVIRECSLIPIGVAEVHGIGGARRANKYLVNIWLPNKVVIPSVEVIEGQVKNQDVLIGMDIINKGDFAVTNYGGKTIFSYRFPSVERIDFVKNPFKSKATLSIPGSRKNINRR
jgi:hypothetical protein